MTASQVKAERRLTGPGARLIVAFVAGGCLAILVSTPQPVLPAAGPSLRFPNDELSAVLARDRSRARNAPDDELVGSLTELYSAHGLAEVGVGETEEVFAERSQAAREAAAAVEERHGAEGIQALRSKAVEGLFGALEGEREDEGAFLGSFPSMLERYGATVEGQRVAPPLVIRTLFAARWNGVLGYELTRDFEPVELQAYWGWLALHGTSAPVERRQEALRSFQDAGGLDAAEASAWFAFERANFALAARAYQAASELTGNVRLRNHAMACQSLIE